jgi:PAS domain S-box-containing protein
MSSSAWQKSLRWLFEPTSSYARVASSDQTLLQRLLWLIFCVLAVGLIRSLIEPIPSQWQDVVFQGGALVAVSAAMLTNRAHKTRLAVWIAALTAIILISYAAYPDIDTYDIYFFDLATIALLLSALFLTPIATFALILLCAVAMIGIALITPAVTVGDIVFGTFLYVATMGVLLVIANQHMRNNVRIEREDLVKNEELLKKITSNLVEIITLTDLEGRITYQSKSLKSILGYELGDVTQSNNLIDFRSLIHPDDSALVIDQFEHAHRTQTPTLTEVRVRHHDGTYRYIETMVQPSRDRHDQIDGFIYVSRDVSERKQVEATLFNERNLLRNLIDSMPYHIYMKDRQHRFLLNNRNHIEVLGASSQEDLYGKTDMDVFPSEMAQEFMADEAQIMQTGKPLLGKIERTRAADGKPIWGLVSKVPMRDADGNIIGIIGSTLDITQEVEMRNALRHSEGMQKALLEALPDLMFRMNVDGVFLDYKASKSMNLYTPPESFLGRNIRDVLPEAIAEQSIHWLRRAILTGEMQIHEYDLDVDGNTKSFEARIVVSGPDEIISIVRDVTERNLSEQNRLEKERLQGALDKEREIGELKQLFSTTLSHEFRTPLATIMTSVGLLEHYAERITPERQREGLQTIRAQVTHLVNMLNDVLTIMQVQGNQLRFNPQPTDVETLVRSIVEEFQLSLGLHHQLTVEVLSNISIVPIDDRLFRYTLFNLLSNAIKYSAPNTQITTRLERSDGVLCLSVSDQGIGIPAEDQQKLFQPFHRARNAKSVNGSGLGLKIVKDCVEMHGGSISVESRENVGTTFIVTLPTEYRDKRRTTNELRMR